MTKRIFIIVMMLCASVITYAQVEQASQKLAEAQHKQFASELSNSLKSGKGKPVFGKEGNDKQFLLEDEEPFFTEYLGWKRSQFPKRNLLSVYQGLLSATKQKDAKKKVSVKITFPLDDTEFKGQATNKSGKAIKDVYTVATMASVTVEASKQGAMTSVAKNNLTLNWEVAISLNKKTGAVDTKASRAILKSISVEPASGFFPAEKQQIQAVAEKLIKDYYQSLRDARYSAVEIPDEWKNPLQTSAKRDTEGEIMVALPSTTSFEVKTVPALKIYVSPESYHKVALGFRIAINDDLQSGRIVSVNYNELEKPRMVEPKPEPEIVAKPEPVVVKPEPEPKIEPKPIPVVTDRGRTYKVQILSALNYVAVDKLPQQFRVDNITIEKYVVGGSTYYKYVVPAGTTLSEAFAVRKQLRDKGLNDAWIAVYENGVRVSPNEGMPELVK